MYLLILYLPIISALLSINRKCGYILGPILSTKIMGITALLGILIYIEVGYGGSPVSMNINNWIQIIDVEWALIFDSLTAAMLIPVLLVSALVQLYSLEYMSTDQHKARFFSYLSIFTFFMLILITADNLLVLFVGWEGVGLASYFLINFWFSRIAANMAALKAFLLNRIGDWALTIGIILTICIIRDISFSILAALAANINTDLILILAILFLIGASAKSAQFGIGLNNWLASAMEGPTPVSSLIHAATMVTAGVYLLMRLSPLLEWSSNSLLLITYIGGMSAFLGAACGLLENDIKRVIAYSTTSQLGYMILTCGLSLYPLSLFHLINHAFFKALLFLSAGSVIHAIADQQDMRKMGSLILLIPFSYIGILLGSLSLMAFPFLTGFYSKDLILELTLIPHNYTRAIAYIFAILAAFLSVIYSIKLLILSFISKPNFPYILLWNKSINDPKSFMLIPIIILSIGAVYYGYLFQDTFLGLGSSIYLNCLFIHPMHFALLDGNMLPIIDIFYIAILKYLPLLTFVFLLSIFPITLYWKNNWKTNRQISILSNKWTLSKNIAYSSLTINHFNIFNHWIIYNILSFSNILLRYYDRGVIELIGPLGLVQLIQAKSFK